MGDFERLSLGTNISSRCVNTKEQIADIVIKGSCTSSQWSGVMQLVQITGMSNDNILVRSHSQSQTVSPHKAFLFRALTMAQKREVSWSRANDSSSSLTRRSKAMLSSASRHAHPPMLEAEEGRRTTPSHRLHHPVGMQM